MLLQALQELRKNPGENKLEFEILEIPAPQDEKGCSSEAKSAAAAEPSAETSTRNDFEVVEETPKAIATVYMLVSGWPAMV